MADTKLPCLTADDAAPITKMCHLLGKASDERKLLNLSQLGEEQSFVAKLAARRVQEGIGHRKVTLAWLHGGDVDGADEDGPAAKKAKTDDSRIETLENYVEVLLEFLLKIEMKVPEAAALFKKGVAPSLALDSAGINFNGHVSRGAPHSRFPHRFSSTTSRQTTAAARRRPARTRSPKRVATPPPTCAHAGCSG